MRKDAEAKDRQQKEVRVRAAKTKAEYDSLKGVYDKEYKADAQTLHEMRARTEAESKKVDPEMLERYRSIKQHCTPPMAQARSTASAADASCRCPARRCWS